MKALTILQPWASLIACGAKKIETRSWGTKYRGPLAIHAGKNHNTPHCAWEEPFKTELIKADMMHECLGGKWAFRLKHNGCIIAIAELVDCREIYGRTCIGSERKPIGALLRNESHGIEIVGNELAFGDYTPGRYAWILENVRPIDPVPAKGMQRLWEWNGKKHE